MQLYRDYGGQQQNNPLCYIHPLLFPRIFLYAFAYNQVPKSSFETDIPEDSYNATIDQQNLLYVQNQNTILYIYRHRINTIINNTRAVQARYRRLGLIRAPPAF